MTSGAALLDVHVHVAASSDVRPTATVDHVLRIMDRNGIDQAVISPVPTYATPLGVHSSMAENDHIAALVARQPDRFPRGLGVVELRHGAAALPEVDRILGGLGLAGLMFDNDAMGIPIDSPNGRAVLERASSHGGCVVEVHTAPYSVLMTPFRLGLVADAFPGLTFIALTAFHDITQDIESVDLALRHPNILFELAQAKSLLDTVEHAVQAGTERILFGTGIPEGEVFYQQRMVEIAHIDEAAKPLILGANARRVFGLTS